MHASGIPLHAIMSHAKCSREGDHIRDAPQPAVNNGCSPSCAPLKRAESDAVLVTASPPRAPGVLHLQSCKAIAGHLDSVQGPYVSLGEKQGRILAKPGRGDSHCPLSGSKSWHTSTEVRKGSACKPIHITISY